jgi:hypothetical protein
MNKVLVLSRRGVGAAILIAVSSAAVTSIAHGQMPGVGPSTAPFHSPPSFGPPSLPSFDRQWSQFERNAQAIWDRQDRQSHATNRQWSQFERNAQAIRDRQDRQFHATNRQWSQFERNAQAIRDRYDRQSHATVPRYDVTARNHGSYAGSRTSISRSEPARASRGWFGERRWRARR